MNKVLLVFVLLLVPIQIAFADGPMDLAPQSKVPQRQNYTNYTNYTHYTIPYGYCCNSCYCPILTVKEQIYLHKQLKEQRKKDREARKEARKNKTF